MTVHFITASRGGGKPHVTSGDDARQNVAHIGNVSYVGKTGDQLSASMTSSNTLRILSGDGWICGRHWAVDGFEDVTIDNGNPGYNRKDLVVFHAETSPSDNGYITVIKGEETTGDAVVPTYTEGDLNEGDTVAEMPLYVVSLTGVSVGDPEPQFDVLVPYNEFRTSIVRAVSVYVGAENLAVNRSRYVNTSEIEGYYPIAGIYDRGNTEPAVVASGVSYTAGTSPFIRLINTDTRTLSVSGAVTFIFVRSDVLGLLAGVNKRRHEP